MSGAFRLALTAIVLVNLAFVHATEDASLSWLAPMYIATLASPWLARMSGSAIYRWTWNLAVIGIFSVLVRHTAVAGPRFLLEDGLRLAAVCQVHVLCTLGTKQRPDLLFFNSFLIAVVTAFLTQDRVYCAVFLAYAPLLVVGLSLYAAGNSPATGAIIRNALGRSALALGVTAVVFLACPRDFHRKGLVVDQLTLGPGAQSLEVGFTDEVRLGREGSAGSNDSLVLLAHAASGDAALLCGVCTYWRGATQLTFDAGAWSAGSSSRLGDPRWHETAAREVVRDLAGSSPGVELDVDLRDASAGRVFAPLTAQRAAFTSAAPAESPSAIADGTLRFASRDAGRAVRDVTYHLVLAGTGPAPGGVTPSPAPPELTPALALDPNNALPEVERVANELRRELPTDAPQHVFVERARERLASRTDYLAPGSPEAAADVETFVAGRAGGHCEHFATALALVLRSAKIPCRLVTGYLGDDWDATARTLTIRRRDAHAWVEVKDPQAGWYTVDPTPATARAAKAQTSLVGAIGAWFGGVWEQIVRFDDAARDALVACVAAVPGQTAATMRESPFATCVVAALAVALVVAIRRRRAGRVPADVRTYRASLAHLRLTLRAGETPRQLVARAALEGLPRDAVTRLDEATRRHESARYAVRS